MFDFITASHDKNILENNLGKSDAFEMHDLSIIRDYTNVAKAYNEIKLLQPFGIYIHHDVFLPPIFIAELKLGIARVNKIDPNWGVIGVAGVKLENGRKQIYGYIQDRGRDWGHPGNLPHEVDTLDELLLVTKGDFIFDENLEQDFYGADICMQAKLQGRKNYAVNAYCHHNSGRAVGGRTESFYRSQEYFRKKYVDHLPIATTCALLT